MVFSLVEMTVGWVRLARSHQVSEAKQSLNGRLPGKTRLALQKQTMVDHLWRSFALRNPWCVVLSWLCTHAWLPPSLTLTEFAGREDKRAPPPCDCSCCFPNVADGNGVFMCPCLLHGPTDRQVIMHRQQVRPAEPEDLWLFSHLACFVSYMWRLSVLKWAIVMVQQRF